MSRNITRLEARVEQINKGDLPPVTLFTAWPPIYAQKEIWARAGLPIESLIERTEHSDKKTSLFGRLKDRPSGAAIAHISGDVVELKALQIEPETRRMGLGGLMVRGTAQWALSEGAAVLRVHVPTDDEAALAFFRSQGFSPVISD